MSTMPTGRNTMGRPRGLGQVLADLAAGTDPSQPPASSPFGRMGLPLLMNVAKGSPPAAPYRKTPFGNAGAGGMAMTAAPNQLPQFADEAGLTAPRRSTGQIIAGVLADAIAGATGRPPVVAQMWARERETEREQVQWNRQRQARLEDYRTQKHIDAQYPAQRAPHYFEANNGDRYAIGPDGKPQRIFQDTTPKIQFIPNGQGGVIPVNVSAYTQGLTGGGQPAAGPAPVLDALPPGAKPFSQGGAGSAAPRTFR